MALAALVAMAALPGAAAEGDRAERIAVVVGAASPLRSVSVDTLREVYLRRQRVWPDGGAVLPVNLPPDSPVREAFSRRVLGRRPTDLESYWRRLYFDGVRPPAVLRTPQAVCAYVGVEPSAIGYLPAGAIDPAHCRSVLLLDDADLR